MRNNLNIAIIGDPSSGKSTITGALIADSGQILPRRLAKVIVEVREFGRQNYYSYLVNRKRSEWEKGGKTEDGNIVPLEKSDVDITLMDTSREKRKAIPFLSQCECAVLVVDVTDDTISSNFQGSLMMWISYLFIFKIKQIVVCVNKMDLVDFNQDVFMDRKKIIEKCFKYVGFDMRKSEINIMPTSIRPNLALNIFNYDDEFMPYYTGPTVFRNFGRFVPPERDVDSPGLILFSRAYRIGGVGTVACGLVLRGQVSVGDIIAIVPGMVKVRVRSIEFFHRQVETAYAGQQIGLNLPGISVHSIRQKLNGFFVVSSDKDISVSQNTDVVLSKTSFDNIKDEKYFSIPKNCRSFVADVRFVRNTTKKKRVPITIGTVLKLEYKLTRRTVVVKRIIAKLDTKFNVLEYTPSEIKKGDIVRLEISPLDNDVICIGSRDEFGSIARFILSDSISIVGAGIVQRVIDSRSDIHIGFTSSRDQNSIDFKKDSKKYFKIHYHDLETQDTRGLNLIVVQHGYVNTDIMNFVRGGGSLLILLGKEYYAKTSKFLNQLGIDVTRNTDSLIYDYCNPITTTLKKNIPAKRMKKHLGGYYRQNKKKREVRKTRKIAFKSDLDIELPGEIWYEIFSYLGARELFSVACVSQEFEFMSSDDYLWDDICKKDNVLAPTYINPDSVELLAKSEYKWRYKSYLDALREPGGYILNGQFGQVKKYYASGSQYFLESSNSSVQILSRNGSKGLIAHIPRRTYGKGQILVLTGNCLSFLRARKGNTSLIYNFLHDASRTCY